MRLCYICKEEDIFECFSMLVNLTGYDMAAQVLEMKPQSVRNKVTRNSCTTADLLHLAQATKTKIVMY